MKLRCDYFSKLETKKGKRIRPALCFFLIVLSALCQPVCAQFKGDSLLGVAEKQTDDSIKGYYYEVAGREFHLAGEHERAMSMALKALDVYKRTGNLSKQGFMYDNIAGVYYRLENRKEALAYMKKGLEARIKANDEVGIALSLVNIGVLTKDAGENEKALEHYFKALKILRKNNLTQRYGMVLNNIGVAYMHMEQYHKALDYFEQSLEAKKENKDMPERNLSTMNNMGYMLGKTGQYEKSREILEESIREGTRLNLPTKVVRARRMLSEILHDAGLYEDAYEQRLKYEELQDSLITEETVLKVNELKEQYEAEKKDREITELKLEKHANDEQQKLRWLAVACLLAGLVTAGFFYSRQRKLKEATVRAGLEQRALRAQMNPHFIFNSLNAIQDMYTGGEMEQANDYIEDFGVLLRGILDNSGKERISVKDELQILERYLHLEKIRNENKLAYEITVDENIDQLNTLVPSLIIQPLVENAIWHGILPSKEPGKVKVNLRSSETDKFLVCTVEDTGVGIDNDKMMQQRSHEPKGLELIRQRLGTDLKIERMDQGTRVTITIPV